MRIHGGEARGRKLKTREGKGTRPTDARSREMLFNILGERVVDARVLDLYAGTGAIGLEALSQGARSCLFVEQNAVACRVIRENLRVLKWHDRARVWQNAVKPALRRIVESRENIESAQQEGVESESSLDESTNENEAPVEISDAVESGDSTSIRALGRAHEYSYGAFDIVFADPPFSRPQELIDLMLGLDNAGALLHNEGDRFGGLLVVQHHWKAVLPASQRFVLDQSRRAGESVLSFFHPQH